ncbi:AlpA family phage regulatory protein [Sphingomonas profundi]|uniref:helix-turn-helix transcriptional regulator n=1 Tax=Alterirhizorhabdus profundi TaxID=2681549 RepID=UPI0012E7F09D
MIEGLIRRKELLEIIGISKSQLYVMISRGQFPRPILIGSKRAVGWRRAAVSAWLAARPTTGGWSLLRRMILFVNEASQIRRGVDNEHGVCRGHQ